MRREEGFCSAQFIKVGKTEEERRRRRNLPKEERREREKRVWGSFLCWFRPPSLHLYPLTPKNGLHAPKGTGGCGRVTPKRGWFLEWDGSLRGMGVGLSFLELFPSPSPGRNDESLNPLLRSRGMLIRQSWQTIFDEFRLTKISEQSNLLILCKKEIMKHNMRKAVL